MQNYIVKTYPVSGMSCTSCALHVEKAIKRQPGVKNAEVNYANGSALVEYNASEVSNIQLQSAVRSVGYDLIIDDKNSDIDNKEQLKFRRLKVNMIGALSLSIPVMVLSMLFMNFPNVNIMMLLLTTPVIAWFGRSFFINAWKLAKHGQSSMDTLVALSTGISFLFSVFNTIFPEFWHRKGLHPHVYYEASSIIVAFILIGKYLEEKAKSRTSSAIKNLMGLQPLIATKIMENKEEKEIGISDIMHNDHLRIKPGDKIPVDGIIIEGYSGIDESFITGESIPLDKKAGDHVYAGTINQNGSFILQAKQVGSETILSRIIETVKQAQGSKAPVQKTVDKIASVFVPVVIVISILSFLLWIVFSNHDSFAFAFLAMITVLVIACPCALGLATPTAIMVSMGKGAKNGILIKDSESLETMHKINAIVLDKTGTLTEGKPSVTDIIWLSDDDHTELENIIASIENKSTHPLAHAVVTYFKNKTINRIITEFENIPGKGIKASYDGNSYLIGNLKLIANEGVKIEPGWFERVNKLQEEAKTVIFFSKNKFLTAIIGLADQLKNTSKEAVEQLHKKGIEIHMLTGDNEHTARVIAKQTSIKNYKSEMMPSDKADFIKELQLNGKVVAMVGDGINDSQALAQADVSIAMGKGSDIAMDVAAITIISSDLQKINKVINLSKQTVRNINQNLFWAFIYNIIGIPIAAGILYPFWGFMLNPMIAAAAMALSSVSVVTNSLRLKTQEL